MFLLSSIRFATRTVAVLHTPPTGQNEGGIHRATFPPGAAAHQQPPARKRTEAGRFTQDSYVHFYSFELMVCISKETILNFHRIWCLLYDTLGASQW